MRTIRMNLMSLITLITHKNNPLEPRGEDGATSMLSAYSKWRRTKTEILETIVFNGVSLFALG